MRFEGYQSTKCNHVQVRTLDGPNQTILPIQDY